jgi:hypothetical protein
MRRSRARFSGSHLSIHTRSLADFITIMCGFRFSVHTMASATEPPRTRLTRATLLRPQHDATEPGYFGGRLKWWTKAQREIDPNAILHLSVYERFAAEKVQHVYAMQPHRYPSPRKSRCACSGRESIVRCLYDAASLDTRIPWHSSQITEEIELSEQGPRAPRSKRSGERRTRRRRCAKPGAKYLNRPRTKEILPPNMPGGVLTHPPDDATGPQEISGEIRADVISRVYCLTEGRLAHSGVLTALD